MSVRCAWEGELYVHVWNTAAISWCVVVLSPVFAERDVG